MTSNVFTAVVVLAVFLANACLAKPVSIKTVHDNSNENKNVLGSYGNAAGFYLAGMCYDCDTNTLQCVSFTDQCSCPVNWRQLYSFFSSVSECDAISKCQTNADSLRYVRCQHPELDNRIITCRPHVAGCQTEFEIMMPSDGIFSSKQKCENAQKYFYLRPGDSVDDDFRLAYESCQIEGGQLATVKNDGEWQEVTGLLADYDNATDLYGSTWCFWLGLTRRTSDGVWFWKDGDKYQVEVGDFSVTADPTDSCTVVSRNHSGPAGNWYIKDEGCQDNEEGHLCESFIVD